MIYARMSAQRIAIVDVINIIIVYRFYPGKARLTGSSR